MTSQIMKLIEVPLPGCYIVAVSGGVDSMALLHMLAELHNEHGLQLHIAHFNHGIRGDSGLDQRLVAKTAEAWGLPFHTANGNLGTASEDTARKARYQFLQGLVDRYGADAIITAHHLDDRLETSMYNISRGAGRVGAAGVRSRLSVVRPLLGVRKAELIEYAQTHGLVWREDATNSDIAVPRNFLRHELLPLGRGVVPQFDSQFGSALSRLDDLNAQIAQRFGRLMVVSDTQVRVGRTEVGALGDSVLGDLMLVMAHALQPDAEVSRATLVKAAAIARRGRVGDEASISGQLMLRVRQNELEMYHIGAARQPVLAQELPANASIRFGVHQLSYSTMHIQPAKHYHVIAGDLKVRAMRPGDRIAAIGLNGTKKLQDLFVDAKIDRSDRLSWPVVARISDDQIVWVPRLAVSRHFLVSDTDANAHCLIHEVVTA